MLTLLLTKLMLPPCLITCKEASYRVGAVPRWNYQITQCQQHLPKPPPPVPPVQKLLAFLFFSSFRFVFIDYEMHYGMIRFLLVLTHPWPARCAHFWTLEFRGILYFRPLELLLTCDCKPQKFYIYASFPHLAVSSPPNLPWQPLKIFSGLHLYLLPPRCFSKTHKCIL